MTIMICENCGINSNFKKLGHDESNNLILECQGCGAICYEDGTLVEGEITITDEDCSNA
jgi:uncharacterized Zn finger protein